LICLIFKSKKEVCMVRFFSFLRKYGKKLTIFYFWCSIQDLKTFVWCPLLLSWTRVLSHCWGIWWKFFMSYALEMLSSFKSIGSIWKWICWIDSGCILQFGYLWNGNRNKWVIKKNVKRDLLIFRHYQVDVKEITCLLRWWEKHEVLFPINGFLTQQMLGIVGSQIETKS
jgi:hypothetical protein